MNQKRPLRVFLCHASQDKPAVRRLHRYLKQRGIQPWLDELDLLPGENWEVEIPRAIDESDVILVCLSNNSVNKEGYVQKEISFALDKALEKPENTIFIIPAKLEECEVPKSLNRFQWVDLFRPDSNKRLLMGLNRRAASIGPDVMQVIIDEAQPKRTASHPVTKTPEIEKPVEEKPHQSEPDHPTESATHNAVKEELMQGMPALPPTHVESKVQEKSFPRLETGKKNEQTTTLLTNPPAAASSKSASPKKPSRSQNLRWWGIGGIAFVGVMILLLGVLILLLSGNYLFNNLPLTTPSPRTNTPTFIPTTSNSATMSNVRMAKDQDGAQPTSTFGVFDTVYIVGDLAAVQVGNTVETRWYTDNVDGYDPNFLIDNSSLTLETKDYDFFYFEFPAPPEGWPTGTYKVEVYFNGVLNTTVTYSVQ